LGSTDELQACLLELREVADRLAKVPMQSRELFLIMLNRAKPKPPYDSLEVSVPDIQQATRMIANELRESIAVLNQHNLIAEGDRDDAGAETIGIRSLKSHWPVWSDIRNFCKAGGLDLSQLIIDLNFSVLDD
jgi:hypothetical protein